MSDSRRHTEIGGCNKERSSKLWKRQASGRLRQRNKMALQHGKEYLFKSNELNNNYDRPGDKFYFGLCDEELKRRMVRK